MAHPLTFDVPGTVTLRDVSRPAAGETVGARIYRLAQKAVIENVQLIGDVRRGRVLATSARRPATCYAVNLADETCTCDGFAHTGMCKHLALALMELVLTEQPEAA